MVEDVAFSPDGKTLAMASREGSVQLWDVATGKHLETLKGHSGAVSAVVFSPDGRTLASGSHDHTVRLWNIETRRQLMQLDPGNIELGFVQTLAFSPDGERLLAGGSGTAFWATAPTVWNDPDRAALQLRLLLHSNADFPSRIRMLSENLRLHEALAKLDAKEQHVQAALAATQANWHASRKAWPQAVAAFDRLTAVDTAGPDAWLRTPGLLRLATALLQENRPAVAAIMLQGGAKRRTQDGLPAIVERLKDEGGRTKDEGGPLKAEGKPKDQVAKASPENLAHPSSFILSPATIWQPESSCIPFGQPSTNVSLQRHEMPACSNCVPSLPGSGPTRRPRRPTLPRRSKRFPGVSPGLPLPTSSGFTAAVATRMSPCKSGRRRSMITLAPLPTAQPTMSC
jgi:hypothetical protein